MVISAIEDEEKVLSSKLWSRIEDAPVEEILDKSGASIEYYVNQSNLIYDEWNCIKSNHLSC